MFRWPGPPLIWPVDRNPTTNVSREHEDFIWIMFLVLLFVISVLIVFLVCKGQFWHCSEQHGIHLGCIISTSAYSRLLDANRGYGATEDSCPKYDDLEQPPRYSALFPRKFASALGIDRRSRSEISDSSLSDGNASIRVMDRSTGRTTRPHSKKRIPSTHRSRGRRDNSEKLPGGGNYTPEGSSSNRTKN